MKIILIAFLLSILSFDAIALSYDYFSNGCTSVHVLTVDPKEHPIIPVKAIKRETVLSLAKQHGALAAVNGGFWKQDGTPAGILKINHQWYGIPTKPRGAIGWSTGSQKVLMDRLLTDVTLYSKEWKEVEHIVGGTPLLIRQGNLIDDYTPEQTLETFLIDNHPRTAVGIKATDEWLFVVVEGCFNSLLGGMTIRELAELMQTLGCQEALNLDGGCSSTLVLEGKVINATCGSITEDEYHLQPVSDAILILPHPLL